MRRSPAGLFRAVSRRVFILALAGSCTAPKGPPVVRAGDRCATCGMNVVDLRFAGAARLDGSTRTYDSVECLLRDVGAERTARIYLSDFETAALWPADSVWIVIGSIPSPMGGGLAAYRERADADRVAEARDGWVERISALRNFDVGKP